LASRWGKQEKLVQSDSDVRSQRIAAKAAAARLAQASWAMCSAAQRDLLLRNLAGRLRLSSDFVLQANAQDVQVALAEGYDAAFVDRLRLSNATLQGVADDVERVAALPDPLAWESEVLRLPSGLHLRRKAVPLGVLGVIYESRPNVTMDVAAAALKAGNAVVLRGGREARLSNLALMSVIQDALQDAGIAPALVSYIDEPERDAVLDLLRLQGLIDVVIPRGGKGLVDLCRQHARMPLIAGGAGVVHLYVDRQVDVERAVAVIRNAKAQRPSACNALDTLLVNVEVATVLLLALVPFLIEASVQVHAADSAADHLRAAGIQVHTLQTTDLDQEWLALQMNIVVVADLETAIAHIARHGSGHSEAILTDDPVAAARFLHQVDAAAVYHNASPRFSDGGQFGMGVEVAVSTSRLHPRGPVGPAELISMKWIGTGDYLARP
jgi:glutamate-5-semialdehyde dehydrogenase